jgi:hypothetical protein
MAPDTNRTSSHDDDVQELRTNFAILHFAFTVPKYSISLLLFLVAKCIPLTTPYEAIHRPLAELHRLVEVESDSYLHCTQTAFDRAIHSEIFFLARIESDVVVRAQKENKAFLERGQKLSQDCFHAASKARHSLQTWHADNADPPARGNETCSNKDRLYLNSFLGDENNTIFVEGRISSLLEGYVQSNSNSIERIQGYTEARFQYDFDYFVTSKINPTLSYLQEAQDEVRGASFTLMIDKLEVENRLRESLKEMTTIMDDAQARVNALGLQLQEYTSSIETFHTAYADVYQRLVDGADFVTELLPYGESLPEFFDLTTVPVAYSLIPHVFLNQNYDNSFIISTQNLLNRTTQRCFEALQEVYEEVERQTTHKLRGSMGEITNILSDLLDSKDYNPPKFVGSQEGINSIVQEIEHLGSIGQVTQTRAQAVLDHLSPLPEQDFFPDDMRTDHKISDWNRSSHFVQEESPIKYFEYLRPVFPSIFLPEILLSFVSWVLKNAWVLEVLVQALRLWFLEAKYSRGAIPDMPVIDYENDDLEAEDSDNTEPALAVLLCKTLLSVCRSPSYFVVLILLPFCFGATVIWRPHVISNCRDTMQGTYLAKQFLAPLLINRANALGNGYYIKGEIECHQTQRSICEEMQTKLGATTSLDIASHRAIQLHRNHSIQVIRAMQNCIDIEINIRQMDEACCGLKTFRTVDCQNTNLTCPIDETLVPKAAFRPLQEYLDETACLEESFPWELNDSQFRCMPLLIPCNDIPCSGINEEYLSSRIIETDCKVELYILDCCSFLLMAVYQFLAVRLICSMLFQGIRQVYWRNLCPDGVCLHTRLHENGDLARGHDRTDRSKRIVVAIGRFQLVGKLKIAIGIVALVCWGSSLAIFRLLGLF